MKSLLLSLVVTLCAIFALHAAPAHAAGAPASLVYPTIQADLLSRDFLRIALLAESLAELNGRFAYHMYGAGEFCQLTFGCSELITFRANPMQNAALQLAAKAREFYSGGTIPSDSYAARMADLRPYFDELAWARHDLFQAMRETPNLATTGTAGGDRFCGGISGIYTTIMYLIVQYPQELGLGGGHNDD